MKLRRLVQVRLQQCRGGFASALVKILTKQKTTGHWFRANGPPPEEGLAEPDPGQFSGSFA